MMTGPGFHKEVNKKRSQGICVLITRKVIEVSKKVGRAQQHCPVYKKASPAIPLRCKEHSQGILTYFGPSTKLLLN